MDGNMRILKLMLFWCTSLMLLHSEIDSLKLYEIRLVDGPCPNAGRLEIYYKSKWGTVCDDAFGHREAKVACRELGYLSGGIVRGAAFYGRGDGVIWTDSIRCTGREPRISYCNIEYMEGGVYCGHNEDVGVECIADTDCALLEPPKNGFLSSKAVSHGTHVTVSCDSRYSLSGNSSLSCQCGLWAGKVGICTADCSALTAPFHGSLSSKATHDGTKVRVFCDINFTLIGTAHLECQSGLWTGDVGICEADCSKLEIPRRGSLSSTNVSHGTVVSVICDSTFSLSGYKPLICQSGTWQGEIGICRKDCPEPSPPSNGNLSLSAVTHGSELMVLCQTGYTLIRSTQGPILCLSGTWTSDVGTCVQDCPKLRVPDHGSLTSTAVVHGTQVSVICVNGFTTFGNNSRKCIDGQWTGEFTTCEADCPQLPIPDHGFLTSTAVSHETQVRIMCETGYTASGCNAQTCISGHWTGELATCEADCPMLDIPDHGSLTSTSVADGTQVGTICDSGYTLYGNSTRICISGYWTGEMENCEEVTSEESSDSVTTIFVAGGMLLLVIIALVVIMAFMYIWYKRKHKQDAVQPIIPEEHYETPHEMASINTYLEPYDV